MRLDFDEEHGFHLSPNRSYPMLPVRLINGSRFVDTYALLDSGADDCLFHAQWARRIGLRLEAGRREVRLGIHRDHKTVCYCHTIELTVGDTHTVRCDVAFSEEVSDDPLNQLIGREVVFDSLRFALRQGAGKLYVGGRP